MTDSPAPRAGASAVVRQDGREARVALRAPASAVAGAPLELSFVVENRSDAPLFVAFSASRATLRPAGFTVRATLEAGETTVELDDPAAGAPEMGGPAGTAEVAPGAEWTQPLLLNEFARLEAARAALAPGASGTLRVRVARPLPLAASAGEAFAGEGAPATDLSVEIELARDDAALEAELARIAGEAKEGVMAARQHAARILASLRVPQAAPHLRALAEDADGGVRMLARRGLAALPENGPSGDGGGPVP